LGIVTTSAEGAGPVTGVILGAGEARLWGMSARERMARIFRRAGLAIADDGPRPEASGTVLLANAAWIIDEPVLKALATRPGAVLVTETGQAVAAHVDAAHAASAAAELAAGVPPPGLEPLEPAALAYNSELRKREPPVLVRLTPANARAVEARTFAGSYKGVTDIVTKYLWPRPARIVTRWCALAGVTPNQVTLVGLGLTLAAFWLFWRGQFGWGLLCAWIMTFLDTVDGKLARVTLTSSSFGNVLDHGIDLISPPFWWWAWWMGLQARNQAPAFAGATLTVIVVGYVLQRVLEGIFIRAWGFHMHAWRPFDSFFRLITARRNPNLLILTPAWLLGRPDIGLFLMALWTAASLAVHALQVAQAAARPRDRVVSWLAA
jgi:phosphatidylglycerophosphate synthase